MRHLTFLLAPPERNTLAKYPGSQDFPGESLSWARLGSLEAVLSQISFLHVRVSKQSVQIRVCKLIHTCWDIFKRSTKSTCCAAAIVVASCGEMLASGSLCSAFSMCVTCLSLACCAFGTSGETVACWCGVWETCEESYTHICSGVGANERQ